MYYLKDYREGQKLVGTYLCKTKQVLKTKAGKTYYSLTLQDKTAIVDAKIWDCSIQTFKMQAFFLIISNLVKIFLILSAL